MEAVNRQLKILILGAGGSVDVSCARLAGAVARDVLSCSAALRSGNGDYFRYSPDLEVCRGVSVPEDCKYFSRYGLSFLMHGLPPAVVEKVKILPHDSPLFARMQRVAARVMQNASMETDSDGEVIEDKSGSDDSSEDADTEDEGDEEEESEEDDETDESDEAYEEEEEEDEVDEDEDKSDKWLNF
uniref:WGS project CAEQ00000000 data, annotated contig 308 n=1 Tax=Trypanosoma congolense (strain IL3000) TaxID=1068625 RepID=F9WER8_TRYCI|nr:unnamed protein product [Trypanosoma congolense IL3000]